MGCVGGKAEEEEKEIFERSADSESFERNADVETFERNADFETFERSADCRAEAPEVPILIISPPLPDPADGLYCFWFKDFNVRQCTLS